jgi:hypothetical protein
LACSITIRDRSAVSGWETRSSRKPFESRSRSLVGRRSVLALVEVEQQRVDLFGLEPGAERVEQLEQDCAELLQPDFELPGAVRVDEVASLLA